MGDSYCWRLGAVKLFGYPGAATSVIWFLPIHHSSAASAFSTPSLHNSLTISLFGKPLFLFWQLLNSWVVASSATTWPAAWQLFSQLGWLTAQLSQPPIVFRLYCCCPLCLMISECAIKSGRKRPPERRLVLSQGIQHREVSQLHHYRRWGACLSNHGVVSVLGTHHALISLAPVKGVPLVGHWPSYKKFQGHPGAVTPKKPQNLHKLKVAFVETAPSRYGITTCDLCVIFPKSSVECAMLPGLAWVRSGWLFD